MEDKSKRKRRRSIRNLRRQSISFGSVSDNPVTSGNESLVSTTDEEVYGSLWLDGEQFMPSTNCTRILSSQGGAKQHETIDLSDSFASRICITGRSSDLSPIELARYSSDELTPKVMTPNDMFTSIKSLEKQTQGISIDNSMHISPQSLDVAFLDETFDVSPNDDPFYKATPTNTIPVENQLCRKISSLSQADKLSPSPSLCFSPMCLPMSPNISCNSESILHELSKGIPESNISHGVSFSSNLNTAFTKPLDKDAFQLEPYDGIKIEIAKLVNDNVQNSEKSHFHDSIPFISKHKTNLSDDGDHVLETIDHCGNVHADMKNPEKPHALQISHIRPISEHTQYLNDSRTTTSSNPEHHNNISVPTTDLQLSDPAVISYSLQDCNYTNMQNRRRGMHFSESNMNNEWLPGDDIFNTPKVAKSPSRLQAKRLASGAVNFIRTIATKLSKEKKNRRKSNFRFEGLSAPLVKSPKESLVLPVESEKSDDAEKENICPDSVFIPESDMIGKTFNGACTMEAKLVTVEKSSEFNNPNPRPDLSSLLILDNSNDSVVQTTNPEIVEKAVEKFMSCAVGELEFSNRMEILSSVSETTDVENTEESCSMTDSLHQPLARRNRRPRRSTDFSLISESDTSDDQATGEVFITSRRSRRRSFEMCRRKIEQQSNSLSSDVSDDNADVVNPQPCSGTKPVRRYRKKNEENLEDLYRNKNFKMPTKKTWETIFEDPHNGTLISKKKQNRSLLFEAVPPAKLKRRQQKAAKLGWDITGRKRMKMNDDYVSNVINTISVDLASIDVL